MKNRPPFRVGVVKEQDLVNARLRVVFQERDQLVSWWLPIVMAKTQNDKAYWMPDIGEQVVCLMDERDEDGAVLGAIYSSVDATPVASANKWHVTMKDGATFEYDRTAHVLDMKFSDGAEIKYDAGAHALSVNAPSATVTVDCAEASVTASGAISLQSGADIALKTVEHNTTLDTIIDTYNSHTHSGVQSGTGDSGPPIQEITP